MKVGIIGAGLIGRKRALALPKGVKLEVVCDVERKRGIEFAGEFGCKFEENWRKVVSKNEIEAVFVATTHDWLTPIGAEAIKNDKHVFIEKPGARSLAEFESLVSAYKRNPRVLMLGYNHRYHPAIQKARKFIRSEKYGRVMFVRAKYGHGGRVGYETEWRFNKEISGGGELIDQGSHLIDLVNYLVGPMEEMVGFLGTMFWRTKLEDAAFWLMRNKKGQVAQLSVTCVEWKNVFCFEIMLEKAKIQIDGLGKSYGREKLTLYKMRPEMGPPDKEEFEFGGEDISWAKECELFFDKIKSKDYSSVSLYEGRYVHRVIEKLYKINKR